VFLDDLAEAGVGNLAVLFLPARKDIFSWTAGMAPFFHS
jgi:hypothetical protein